jgi:hypothetical protein
MDRRHISVLGRSGAIPTREADLAVVSSPVILDANETVAGATSGVVRRRRILSRSGAIREALEDL